MTLSRERLARYRIGSEWLEPFRLRYPEEFRNTDDKAQEAEKGREPWTRKSEGRSA